MARNKGEIISATEAARIMGCSPQLVREHIRRGVWHFGECIPGKKLGRKSDEFIVYRGKLYRHMGKQEKEGIN